MVLITGIGGGLVADYLGYNKLTAITGAVGLGGLISLLYYAFLTKKIAEGTERNTRAVEESNIGFYPSLSFHPDEIRINVGNFVVREEGEYFLFPFFVFNRRPVAGKVKFDFYFLNEGVKGELKDSGIFIFSESVFDPKHEPESERYYDFQPDQMNAISAHIIKGEFEKWIDTVYPGLEGQIPVKNKTIKHKIQKIYEETNRRGGITQPSRLHIRIKLTARPYGITSDAYDYVFEKTFYLRFRGAQFDCWDIVGHM